MSTTCPHCEEKLHLRQRIAVLDDVPVAYVDGERLKLRPAMARMLVPFAKKGSARISELELIANSRGGGNDSMKVQLCHLRRELERYGLTIRSLSSWGYELA